jgi:acetyl esterase/lipase
LARSDVGDAVGNGLIPGQSRGASEQLEDPPWIKELAPKRIVYSVPGMNRVKIQRNLTYKTVAGAELKMDVYTALHSPPSEGRPAVIFIHGGRIPPNLRTKPKDWGAYVSFGELVAASGFVAITFNHRFYSWNSLSDSQSDVMDLISYVRNNAKRLGVDKDRIVLWAVSAGGIFLSQPLRDTPPYIRCLIGLYAEIVFKMNVPRRLLQFRARLCASIHPFTIWTVAARKLRRYLLPGQAWTM